MVVVREKVHGAHIAVIVGGLEAVAACNLQRLGQGIVGTLTEGGAGLGLAAVGLNAYQRLDIFQKFLPMGLDPLGNYVLIHY